MTDIHLKKTRDNLDPRREPYWRAVETGFHMGYRKMPDSGAETWVARFKNRWSESPRFIFHPCGAVTPANNYDAALRSARAEAARLDENGQPARAVRAAKKRQQVSVEAACRGYIAATVRNRLEDRRYQTEVRMYNRFSRWVWDDTELPAWRARPSKPAPEIRPGKVFGDLPLREVTAEDVYALFDAMKDDGATEVTIKRYWHGAIKAALHWGCKKHGIAPGDWSEIKLKAFSKREMRLTPAQRDAFIALCPPRLQAVLFALARVGGRGEDIRTLRVRNVHLTDSGGYAILEHYKAEGHARSERRFPLTHPETRAHFAKHIKGKKPGDLVFPKRPGVAWDDTSLSQAVARVRNSKAGKVLAEREGFIEPVVAYHLRHGAISAMLDAGIKIQDVAAITGTSVAQIMKTYFHPDEQLIGEQLRSM